MFRSSLRLLIYSGRRWFSGLGRAPSGQGVFVFPQRRLAQLALSAALLLLLSIPAAAFADAPRNIADDKLAERAGKVDLNNSSVRRFQQFPGMYPTLAGKIVLGGPYDSVDDVLKLDLSERQKQLFEKYRDSFVATEPEIALNEGFDRINDGQYR